MKFSLAAFLLPLAAIAAEPASPELGRGVTLHWLGDTAPATPAGVSWGVPWPKGAVPPNTPMQLATADGRRVEIQTWPVAYWPDGSVKWSGHAIAATAGLKGPFTLTSGGPAAPSPATEIKYSEDDDAFTIDTGALRARVGKRRSTSFSPSRLATASSRKTAASLPFAKIAASPARRATFPCAVASSAQRLSRVAQCASS